MLGGSADSECIAKENLNYTSRLGIPELSGFYAAYNDEKFTYFLLSFLGGIEVIIITENKNTVLLFHHKIKY